MNFPKLKHAMLCRILPYVVVIGGFFAPGILVSFLPFVPEMIKVLVFILCCIGLVYYIFQNFPVLMMMDILFATIHCDNKARTRYDLPKHRTKVRIEASISHYGRKCAPLPIQPQPSDLRYCFRPSWTVYAKGIEKVVATYHVQFLDKDEYQRIFRSARTNAKVLNGLVKPRFLDKEQKKAPLNRVAVIVIFAERVDETLQQRLYEEVCKQCGDEFENSLIPCVIDLERRVCVFNSCGVPYCGFQYAVKNRGIHLVKRLIFGGRIRLRGNAYRLAPLKEFSIEDTLWDVWRMMRREFAEEISRENKRFERMGNGEIQLRKDCLYLKYGNKGICQSILLDAEKRSAKVECVDLWTYPKTNKIGKKTIQGLENRICEYLKRQGYTVTFVPAEDFLEAEE